MASSEGTAVVLQPSHSQWYVTDLSLSLQFRHHNLAIISVLVFSFLLLLTLLFFHFLRQYRQLSSASGTRSSRQQLREAGNKQGLDEATINSLPTFSHASLLVCSGEGGGGVEEISECSICLGMFEENDSVKVIPKCMHVYHLECLDQWLHNHANCPLCRSTIDTFGTRLPA